MKLRPFLIVGVGLAIGYVLGARAGRERYDQLRDAANRIWSAPRFVAARSDSSRFVRENAPLVGAAAVEGAKDAAARTADLAKDVASKTAETAKDVAAKTADTAKDVASKTADLAKDVAGRTADAAKDLVEAGQDVVERVATSAATARDAALEAVGDDEDAKA